MGRSKMINAADGESIVGAEMSERRDVDGLASRIVEILDERIQKCAVPEDVCKTNNEYVSSLISKQRAAEARMETIKTQVTGWGIIAILSGIGTGAFHAFQYLREHLK